MTDTGKSFRNKLFKDLNSSKSVFSNKEFTEADCKKVLDNACKQIKAEKVIKQQPYDIVQSTYGMETSRQHIYPYIIFTKDSLYSISFSKYGLNQFFELNFSKINVNKKIILDLVQNFHIVIIGITKNKVIVNKQLAKKSTYDAITKKYPNAKVNIITGSIIFN